MAQYGVTRLEENTLVGQGEQACLRRCEWIVSLPTVPLYLMDGFSRSEPIIYIRIMITFTRFLHSQTLIQSQGRRSIFRIGGGGQKLEKCQKFSARFTRKFAI